MIIGTPPTANYFGKQLKPCSLIKTNHYNKWDKVLSSGLSKFCGKQPFKNFKEYGLLWSFLIAEVFLLGSLFNTLFQVWKKNFCANIHIKFTGLFLKMQMIIFSSECVFFATWIVKAIKIWRWNWKWIYLSKTC